VTPHLSPAFEERQYTLFCEIASCLLLAEQAQEVNLGFRPGREGLGSEAKHIDCPSGFFNSLRAVLATVGEVFAQLQRVLIG
jgi:hypothetical protein